MDRWQTVVLQPHTYVTPDVINVNIPPLKAGGVLWSFRPFRQCGEIPEAQGVPASFVKAANITVTVRPWKDTNVRLSAPEGVAKKTEAGILGLSYPIFGLVMLLVLLLVIAVLLAARRKGGKEEPKKAAAAAATADEEE